MPKKCFSILCVFSLLIHFQAAIIDCAQPSPHQQGNYNNGIYGMSSPEGIDDETMEYMGNATVQDWDALFTADEGDIVYTKEELKELQIQLLPCRLEKNFIPRYFISIFLKSTITFYCV